MIKRVFDIVFSLTFLAIFSPIMLLIAIVICIQMGTPIFFRQKRAGKDGAVFEMIKFRTMTNNINVNGEVVSDTERTGRLGRFLRKSSLDELPELWNILKGNMSVVGPRPLLIEYLPYYSDFELRRHEVRPGLTGLAQISGRNSLGWDERLTLDVQYVKKNNFLFDLKIIAITILKVVKGSDIQVITGGACRLDDVREKGGGKRNNG